MSTNDPFSAAAAETPSQEEDDESLWEPLVDHAKGISNEPGPVSLNPPPIDEATPSTTTTKTAAAPSASSSSSRGPGSRNNTSPHRATAAETNDDHQTALQQALIHHPIQLFWSRFLVHFAQQLWQLDFHLRLAMVFVASGALLYVLVSIVLGGWWYSSFLYTTIIMLCSPRWILLIVLLLGPWVYLERITWGMRIDRWVRTITESPEHLAETLASVEPSTMQTVFFTLLLLPTFLEARTLVFLAHVELHQQEQQDVSLAFYFACYHVIVATLLLALQYYLWRYRRLPPRECSAKAVILLYGAALILNLCFVPDFKRWPWLAPPFLTSTGVLLWSVGRCDINTNEGGDESGEDTNGDNHDPNVLSFVIRQALRHSVRDVLEYVGTNVQRDEMLQLALVRWIVDYWTTTKPSTGSRQEDTGASPSSHHPKPPTRPQTTAPSDTPAAEQQQSQPTQQPQQQQQEQHLDWQDLFPMLKVTADQMATEAESIRHDDEPSAPSGTSQQSSASGGPASARHSSNATAPSDNDPFDDLKSMLLNWDIDESAKPTVQTIERGVDAFPPSRQFAIFFAIARRCPAFLAIVYQIALGRGLLWSTLLVLIALLVFELVRVHEWIASCHRATILDNNDLSAEGQDNPMAPLDHAEVLQNLDIMVILLSEDIHVHNRPASLLRVWWNVNDSVAALRTGLTAARCVQSTAIAAEFADNLASLARFGLEVHQHGWQHGLMVAAREAFVLHEGRGVSAGYAHATYGAFYNSQRLYKHANALAEEGQIENLWMPLLGVIPVLIGHGWLWAQNQHSTVQPPRSTVVIEEIRENESDEEHDTCKDTTNTDEKSETMFETIPRMESGNHESMSTRDVHVNANQNNDLVSSALKSVKEEAEQSGDVTIKVVAEVESVSTASLDPQVAEDLPKIVNNESHRTNTDTTLPRVDANQELLENRTRLMDLIAKCQVGGLLDEAEKDRMYEDMASFGDAIDLVWLKGNIRTLEGLLTEHEQTLVVEPGGQETAHLESSTDDLFSVSLRSSLEGVQSIRTGHATNLGESDEWEGLGTASSKASMDSLVAVDEEQEVTKEPPLQQPVEQNQTERHQSTNDEEGKNSDASKILVSVAAIGAAAFGAFLAASSRQPPPKEQDRTRTKHTNDSDWVQVDHKKEDEH